MALVTTVGGMGSAREATVAEQLRAWRLARGLSQLEVASAAGTTTRHLSFVETGRSRPGLDLVRRLTVVLDIPSAATELLTHTAGFATMERPERNEWANALAACEPILAAHDPLPACVLDGLGSVVMANAAYLGFVPDALSLTADEQVDRFFGEEGRRWIANWEEVAWREADRRLIQAHTTGEADAIALALRARSHLSEIPRPVEFDAPELDAITVVRVGGGRSVALRTVVFQPDGGGGDSSRARPSIELTYPADPDSGRWLAGCSDSSGSRMAASRADSHLQ